VKTPQYRVEKAQTLCATLMYPNFHIYYQLLASLKSVGTKNAS